MEQAMDRTVAPANKFASAPACRSAAPLSTLEHESKVIVETERLVLRQFCLSDADAMNRVFGDPEVMRFGDGVQLHRSALPGRSDQGSFGAEAFGFGIVGTLYFGLTDTALLRLAKIVHGADIKADGDAEPVSRVLSLQSPQADEPGVVSVTEGNP